MSEHQTQTQFLARMPTATFRRLRALAGLSPTVEEQPKHAVLVRLPTEVYQQLLGMSLALSARRKERVTMQSVVIDLVERANPLELPPYTSMQAVVVDLIRRAAKLELPSVHVGPQP